MLIENYPRLPGAYQPMSFGKEYEKGDKKRRKYARGKRLNIPVMRN
jgi:hypothetical protein